MKAMDRFLAGHARYSRRWDGAQGDALQALAQGQNPEALIISCSDSRVIPELILSADPGALFVVRNIANLIPPFETHDESVGAAISYAIQNLGVRHVIVLGHYCCGGMAATRDLYAGHDHDHDLAAPLPVWLRFAKDSWDELVAAGHEHSPDWHDRLVEENVLQQLANLIEYPIVHDTVEAGKLELHAWVYDLGTGDVRFWDPETQSFHAGVGTGAMTIDQIKAQDNA